MASGYLHRDRQVCLIMSQGTKELPSLPEVPTEHLPPCLFQALGIETKKTSFAFVVRGVLWVGEDR